MKLVVYIIMVLGLCSFTGAIAFADDQDRAFDLLHRGMVMPLEKIVANAKHQHGGHVLEVELHEEHGKYYYELEMLSDDGKVWKYSYEADSGKLIKTKKED